VRPALFPAGQSAFAARDAPKVRAFSRFRMKKVAFAAARQKFFSGRWKASVAGLGRVRSAHRKRRSVALRNCCAAFLKHFFARTKIAALAACNSYAAQAGMPTAAEVGRSLKLFLQSC